MMRLVTVFSIFVLRRSRSALFVTLILLLSIALFPDSSLFARSIPLPQDFGYAQTFDYLLDAGVGWKQNRLSHPLSLSGKAIELSDACEGSSLRWIALRLERLTARLPLPADTGAALGIRFMAGTEIRQEMGNGRAYSNTAVAPFYFVDGLARHGFFAKLEVRATNVAKSLQHYTAISRDIARAGFNSGEVDRGAVGWQGKGVKIELGRGREIWGPCASDNIILPGATPAYERISFELEYKRITVRFFTGHLEGIRLDQIGNAVQRYIAGRMFEWRLNSRLILGAGEISVYQGLNRPPDWSFFNPIALHLEIDQNLRSNVGDDNLNNAIWVAWFDWLALKSTRLSGGLLVDEFQLDQSDRKEGRTDLLGYQLRAAWTRNSPRLTSSLIGEWVRIGSYTGLHAKPYAALSTRGEPLLHPLGNDAEMFQLGLRLIPQQPLIVTLETGITRMGEMSLLLTPYRSFETIPRIPFPSGYVSEERFASIRFEYYPMNSLSVAVGGKLVYDRSGPHAKGDRANIELTWIIPVITRKF